MNDKNSEPEKTIPKDSPYRLVVTYVKDAVLSGKLQPGDRLMGERDLAEALNVSRNSVREGLRVLENTGLITSQHGAGHYVSMDFDRPMTEMLSLIFMLKGMENAQLMEFRYCLEREAMHLAVKHATMGQKRRIADHLDALLQAQEEEERTQHDVALHRVLVEASGNEYLMTSYNALLGVMEEMVPVLRGRIIEGMHSKDMLEETHRMLVRGVTESDLETGLQGLQTHFDYIRQYQA